MRIEIRVSIGEPDLAEANSDARAKGGELRQIAVRPEGEFDACRDRKTLRHRPDIGGLTIEADQAVILQIVEAARRAVALQVAPVGVARERYVADVPDDQSILRGLCHANGDVGLAVQQVLDRIRSGKLYLELGIRLLQRGEDRRQNLDGNDFAGADANSACDRVALA